MQLFLAGVGLFLFLVIFLLLVSYLYYRYCFAYWKKKGVPQLSPSFPLGDLASSGLGKESIYVRLQNIYNEFKTAGHKFGGIYFLNGPVFFPIDPDLIKKILVTDFDNFFDRGLYMNREKVPLSVHIFAMRGEEWRNVRMKLSPVFTPGRVKKMYKVMLNTSQILANVFEKLTAQQTEVNIKELLTRYTTDIMGSTTFGIDANTLQYPDSEFARMVASIFKIPTWKLFKIFFQEGLQNPGNIIKIVEDNEILLEYFNGMIRDNIEHRDKNNIVREDFLDMLMQMRSSGMEFQEIVSQSFLFFAAGFENSSSTISYCIHELAHNQKLQDKLRKEIREKLGRDLSKYTYDDVMALPYLDKCVKETLRKYPPNAMTNRIVVKPYRIPGTDIVLEEGTPVILSVLGLHQDPEYFPNPLKFDPERFNSENIIQPFTYVPFGEGPKNCIGSRFAMIQMKLGLAALLNDFKFSPSPKSPRDLTIDPRTITVIPIVLGGVHARVVKA